MKKEYVQAEATLIVMNLTENIASSGQPSHSETQDDPTVRKPPIPIGFLPKPGDEDDNGF